MSSVIRYIIFDLGDTLVYFNGDVDEVVARADRVLWAFLREQGLSTGEDEFATEFRARVNAYYAQRLVNNVEGSIYNVLKTYLNTLGLALPEETLRAALKALYAVTQDTWTPEADALPTLAALAEQGYRMGIISNAADDADVQVLVDKVGARPYMDFVISSSAFGWRKPDVRIFEYALGQWGAKPDEAVIVGDTPDADMQGANRIGMRSVWITRRALMTEIPPDQPELHPTQTIHALSELPEVLKSMGGL
jgi:HAD superfamily hydrolase (TIGR01662 family)